MSGETHTNPGLLENWHLRMLEIDEGQSSAEQRAEILHALEENAFLPDYHVDSAIDEYVQGDVSPVRKWQSCEQLLRNDVEQFSDHFFALDSSERRATYDRLIEDAEHFPVLKRRLQRLETGLDLDPGLPEDSDLLPETSRLNECLLQLFPAAPRASAALRREWQADIEQNRDRWRMAVSQLKRYAPQLAQTAPELLEWIVNPPQPQQKARPVSLQESASGSTGNAVPGWTIALIALFVIRGLAFLARNGGEDSPSPSVNSQFVEEFVDDFLEEQRRQDQQEDLQELLDSLPQEQPRFVPAGDESVQFEQKFDEDEDLQAQLATLAELQEYDSLDVGSELYFVSRELDRLHVVFRDEQALNVIEICDRMSPAGRQHARLFQQTRRDYYLFWYLADRIRQVQHMVYVTYPGLTPDGRRDRLRGTELSSLAPVAGRPELISEQSLAPDSRLDDFYRFREIPPGEADD